MALSLPPIPGTLIIGIGHKARQGKDTAAKAIIRASGGEAVRYSFAEALRAVARVEHGMTRKDAPLLQYLGTDHYRQRDPDIWVRTLYWQLDEERPAVAIITDVRYPNEMEFVRALGGECWKVERYFPNGTRYVDDSRDPNHISETALDAATWDRVLINPEGEPEVLRSIVEVAYEMAWRARAGVRLPILPESSREGRSSYCENGRPPQDPTRGLLPTRPSE